MTYSLAGTGIWSGALRYGDETAAAEAAAELEELGYSALWIPDVGGDLFSPLQNLLEATNTLTIATGILNLWMHEPAVAAAKFHEYTDRFNGRFLMGIGISHALLIDGSDAGHYDRPLAKTREYLDGLDAQTPPVPTASRLLAALGPKMLELSATRAGGAHTYLVTPEHTAIAREAIGPDRLLATEQAVVLETDPDRARALAREHLAGYRILPNYSNNWLRLGFNESDLDDGCSDRLVDALVVWGDEEAIRSRVQQHRDAGADHVCIQVLEDDMLDFQLDQSRRLAPVLID
ncbi:MAG TPA: LLM class F420-dependent oxidoreductase [Microthrixaceae bacterium]|nr:LLM class F420-dependent oxidoreductase [Microthrixaceae bacterium]